MNTSNPSLRLSSDPLSALKFLPRPSSFVDFLSLPTDNTANHTLVDSFTIFFSAMASHIPHLRDTETAQQLIVHGKPFLIRGAELQNSSFTSAKFMKDLWEPLAAVNLNTILGAVTWDAIEPEEGVFNFEVVDQIILDARKHNLKLILLWFGSWKNGKSFKSREPRHRRLTQAGISNYVPSWVKLSPERFPRAWLSQPGGQLTATEILTPLEPASMKADAKAFATLMRHLKEFDEGHSTVIMVQPENECGILGDSRDRSDIANAEFSKPVPDDLINLFKNDWDNLHLDIQKKLTGAYKAGFKGSSWAEVFGDNMHTDELFMSYYYARYVNAVAENGKAEYPLPMYCNFWLNYNGDHSENAWPAHAGGGGFPGDYPSGGGVSNVLDVWKAFAPHIDFISPDIYLNDYDTVCRTYRHRNQPLFIPEQRRDEYGARRLWRAIGAHQALGVAPFGIDSLGNAPCAYTKHFGLLASVSDIVLEAQRRPGAMVGFFFDELPEDDIDRQPEQRVNMGGYEIIIQRAFVVGRPGPGFGLVILMEDDNYPNGTKFLLVGQGFNAKFRSLDPASYSTGILSFKEKEINPVNGSLDTLRLLNGDETRSGRFCIMPNEDPDYAGFPISITIPAKTRIAEATVYCLKK